MHSEFEKNGAQTMVYDVPVFWRDEMNQHWIRVSLPLLFVASLVQFSVPPANAENTAEATFKAKCAVCHGPDGKGETSLAKTNKLRDLGSADVQKQSDADLAGIVTNGKNKMPAYGKSLKPDQIKDLVAYVRSLAKKS
jgi:mono/diheme cytochrome c family protein